MTDYECGKCKKNFTSNSATECPFCQSTDIAIDMEFEDLKNIIDDAVVEDIEEEEELEDSWWEDDEVIEDDEEGYY